MTSCDSSSVLAARKSLFWRIHLWSALVATPFALAALMTGILYIFTPQIEATLYGGLDRVIPSGALQALDNAVAAAAKAAPPGWTVHSLIPAYAAGDSVRVNFVPAEGARSQQHDHQHGSPKPAKRPAFGLPAQTLVVYVDPYQARVLGTLPDQERFSNWSKKLHSRLLQGEGWRWMIELAASWLMVMLLTGIFLWWPRGGSRVLPQPGMRGRSFWAQWHSFMGALLAVVSLVMLTTGLTWSKYTGDNIRTLRDATGQASPPVPQLMSVQHPAARVLDWQSTWMIARTLAPDVALQLTPPQGPSGTWRVGSADRARPSKRFDLVLDAFSGKQLYYAGWDKQTLFGQATAIGIPFHRGEFGLWNQALLLIFGVGTLFSLISGWVMYLRRRTSGSFSFPRLLPGAWKSPTAWMWSTAIVLLVLMPLLAVSAASIVVFELASHWLGSRRKAAAGQ